MEKIMAAFEKYTDNAVIYKLRHNTREHPHLPQNRDIDPERTQYNYYLHPPEHGLTALANKNYYNQQLKVVYHYNRADVKTACQWVITSPKDLSPKKEKAFFTETYNYLNSLYGEKNCIQAIVHYDEGVKNANGEIIAGQPHLHYMFIPVVKNKGYMQPNKKGNITTAAKYEEKVCVDQLITKQHLQYFHPNYQKWLNEHGLQCTVYSGITGGKNKSVEVLKNETKELEKAKSHIRELEKENAALKEKIISLEKEISKSHVKEIEKPSAWGHSSGWGKEFEKLWETEKEF